jgi:hypothetical protein
MSGKVKEAIEEIIEESYLMGLSEDEIRKDFKRFLDTCNSVIRQNIKDRHVMSGLAESLAREQTCILIADRVEEGIETDIGDQIADTHPFAEKVARRKRQILKIIAEYDPRLVKLIDAQRFKGDPREPDRPRFRPGRGRRQLSLDWGQVKLQLLKAGYVVTVGLIVLLIYLGFIQS